MSQRRDGKPPKCPRCAKPAVQEFAPFCSAGCKDRDLLQWLGEGYRLPGPVALSDEDEQPQNYRGNEG